MGSKGRTGPLKDNLMLWMDTDAEYAKKGKIRLFKGKMKAKMQMLMRDSSPKKVKMY